MRKLVSSLAGVLLVAGWLTVMAAPAQAVFNPAACNTGSDYATSFSGTTPGNVVVPSGATCNLQGATIGGNVIVQPGGRLIIGGGTTVKGYVTSGGAGTDTANPFGTGPEAFSVIICNSTIGGPVSVSNAASQVLIGGTSSTGGGCGGNNIAGNVSVSNNQSLVTVSENGGTCRAPGGTCKIGGSLFASNNVGPTKIFNNVIAGALACSNNAPGAITGGGNTTGGSKTGQCSTF
jgi:hypothetical protein